MKYKTSAKSLRENAINPRKAGYCDLQHLLARKNPVAYTCGMYGWNFDVYEVYNLTITTGYRGMVGERLKYVREFEQLAEEVTYRRTDTDDYWRLHDLEYILQQFCKANGGYVQGYETVLPQFVTPSVIEAVENILKGERK